MILGLHLRGYQFVVARTLLQRNREKISLPRAVVKEYLIHIYAWNVVVKYQGGKITTKNVIGSKNILNNHQNVMQSKLFQKTTNLPENL